MPKLRVDSKLERCADNAAEIVTQNLGEDLVDLRGRRLSANASAERGFDHVKRGLGVSRLPEGMVATRRFSSAVFAA